ncbi:substrate-binding periplasmic protein [Spartinivicinus ruber]|uniref:substrate-binding periplasmic protein n=1 Tax=Spartinivicinus ruber TaxID=2683272 RepID=UPI0013D872F3|nr:ABC transporter substrate-binding protein [Spartinivicinus ruber]
MSSLKKSGFSYEIKYLAWSRVHYQISRFGKNNVCEMTWDASYKDERAKYSYYTVPLYRLNQGIFFSRNTYERIPHIKIADLNKYSICGILGYNYANFNVLKIRRVYKAKQVLNMLDKGRCDFFPSEIEPIMGRSLIENNFLPPSIGYIVFDKFYKTYYGIISKQSPRSLQLLVKINQELIRFREQGVAKKIFIKYGIKNINI